MMSIRVCALFVVMLALGSMSMASLEVGFYQHTCPSVEAIVRQTVSEFVARDPGLAAGLIRLHFHDCFVRGCDASVLLDTIPGSEIKTEKEAPPNNPSLRGFEVIDAAKAAVEAYCPCTVSCSDILAFAARDSAYIAGNIDYAVPSGRRDGRISIAEETLTNLPAPFFNAEQLVHIFSQKGLSPEEMVTLSGAHSIGRSHCSSFASKRLYNFSMAQTTDPSIDPKFAYYLKYQCPPPSAGLDDPTVVLDIQTPDKLDNRYYSTLMKGRGVLDSDQTLWTSPSTAAMVVADVRDNDAWVLKFATAMVKMGSIEVLTGAQGEIRERCRFVN